jgi:prevent-host-death family protein
VVRISSVEFQRNFGRYQDTALTEPVTVMHHGRDRTVLISAEEYRRLKRRDREVLGLHDFTDADLAAIREQHRKTTAAADAEEENGT